MRVLVTGGVGFVGSHLVEALVRKGHDVSVIDDLSSGREENIKTVRSSVRFSKADLVLLENSDWVSKFGVIFHLAAHPWSKAENDWVTQSSVYHANVTGTYNVLRLMRPTARIVFTSTANLYGEGLRHKVVDGIKITSMYGFSKYLAEQMIRRSGRRYQIFRMGTVVGPRGRCFPNRLVWSMINRKSVKLFSNGETHRDIIDVRDVVSRLTLTTLRRHGFGNLGTNSEVSGRQLALIVDSVGQNRGHDPLSVGFVRDSPPGYVKDSTLLTYCCHSPDWLPKHNLRDSIATLFEYYEKKGSIEPPSWESL